MEKLQRKMKSHRISEYVDNCVNETCKQLNITNTLFYEIAVIEKMAKLSLLQDETTNLNKYINSIQKELKMAQERLKKGI